MMAMLPDMLRKDRERWGVSVGGTYPGDIRRSRLIDGQRAALSEDIAEGST